MQAYTSDCAPLDACGPCGTLPGGFVRLRYFYGKRMGVADFVDEQRYVVGKQRFHDQRLHGSGLLCGLAVARQDPSAVVLRVGKGAAIDACGRDIVVGYDQCIDLDAWFQRELTERRATDSTWPQSALDASGNLPVVVAIRYRECTGSPEPAPRDPCGCDAAGCDFGRVREEFELAVLPANDPDISPLPVPATTPPSAAVNRAVGGAVGGGSLVQALTVAATAGCPAPAGSDWLPLATLTATLTTTTTTTGATSHVTDLTAPACAASLLAETSLLQDLLRRELGAQLDAGALVDGPEVEQLALVADGSGGYYLSLELSSDVLAATIPTAAFTLAQLQPTASPAWTTVAVTTDYVASTTSTPAAIRIHVDNSSGFLAKGGLYRLALDPSQVPPATPIVDGNLRALRPVRASFHFGIDQPAANLTLVPPPYAR